MQIPPHNDIFSISYPLIKDQKKLKRDIRFSGYP